MRVLLYIKDTDGNFIHVSTATNEKELDEMMRYATYKIKTGYYVKIQNEQE